MYLPQIPKFVGKAVHENNNDITKKNKNKIFYDSYHNDFFMLNTLVLTS